MSTKKCILPTTFLERMHLSTAGRLGRTRLFEVPSTAGSGSRLCGRCDKPTPELQPAAPTGSSHLVSGKPARPLNW